MPHSWGLRAAYGLNIDTKDQKKEHKLLAQSLAGEPAVDIRLDVQQDRKDFNHILETRRRPPWLRTRDLVYTSMLM